MAIEKSTSLDDVKTTLDVRDGKVSDTDILQKLQDKQTVRDFFYAGSNTLRSYLEKNDSDKDEFTDLCTSILANPANKTILAGVKGLELKDFGTAAINNLQDEEKTKRQELQSLVMIASLYLWLNSNGTNKGTFQEVQNFAKGGLDNIKVDSKKTEVRLGEEPEEQEDQDNPEDPEHKEIKENPELLASYDKFYKKIYAIAGGKAVTPTANYQFGYNFSDDNDAKTIENTWSCWKITFDKKSLVRTLKIGKDDTPISIDSNDPVWFTKENIKKITDAMKQEETSIDTRYGDMKKKVQDKIKFLKETNKLSNNDYSYTYDESSNGEFTIIKTYKLQVGELGYSVTFTADGFQENQSALFGMNHCGLSYLHKIEDDMDILSGNDYNRETSNNNSNETHDFLKYATVDKGTIYHGYEYELDNVRGRLLIEKENQKSYVSFKGDGWYDGAHKNGIATVGGEELSVHIYKKDANSNNKNYTIDINPKVIRLDEQGLLNQKIAKDYTITGQKITSKTTGVAVQSSAGNEIALTNTSSACIFKYENPGTNVGNTLLPYHPSNPTLPNYLPHYPTEKVEAIPGIHMLNRTEEVINLDGKFYKYVSGGVGLTKIYKEITATQISAEEIKKQKEQEEKQEKTSDSYDTMNTGLDTFGDDLMERGKLFENATFRGHLETFTNGLTNDLEGIVKKVVGNGYNDRIGAGGNIFSHFKDVFTFDGFVQPTINIVALKNADGKLNEKGQKLHRLVKELLVASEKRVKSLIDDMKKDKNTITGNDSSKTAKFDTMIKEISGVHKEIGVINRYLANEGLFLSVLDYVNKHGLDAIKNQGLDAINIVASTEKVASTIDSMNRTHGLHDTLASGTVDKIGPSVEKFLKETTPVTIKGEVIYCNKKQLEKNGFVVEKDGKITKDKKPADQLLLDARKRGDIYGESVSQLVGTLYRNDNCTVLTKNKEDIRLKTDAEQKAWLEGLNKSNNNSPLLSAINKDKIVGEKGLTDHIKKHNTKDLVADEDRLVTQIQSNAYPVVTLTDKLVSTPLPGEKELVADLYKVQVIKEGNTEFIYIPRRALEKSLKPYADNLKSSASSDLAIKQQEEVKALSPDPLALFGQKYGINTQTWRKDSENVNSILVGSGDGQFRIDMQDAQKPTLVLPVTYGRFNAKDGSSASEVSVSCPENNVKEYVANAQLLMQQYGKIVAYRKLSEKNIKEYPRNNPQNNTMKFLEEQAGALVKGSVEKKICANYGFIMPSNKNAFALVDFTRNETNKSLVMQSSTNNTQPTAVA